MDLFHYYDAISHTFHTDTAFLVSQWNYCLQQKPVDGITKIDRSYYCAIIPKYVAVVAESIVYGNAHNLSVKIFGSNL